MTARPGVRKLVLTAHVICSVGWMGAAAGFLVLAIAGLTADDLELARSSYIAMELTGWFVLVPLAVGALLTGLMQSLVTKWGLVRHYWVIIKLLITVFATVILLMYMRTLEDLATVARASTRSDLDAVQTVSPVLHGVAALVLLATAAVLGIYKPRGLTPFGQRRPARGRLSRSGPDMPSEQRATPGDE